MHPQNLRRCWAHFLLNFRIKNGPANSRCWLPFGNPNRCLVTVRPSSAFLLTFYAPRMPADTFPRSSNACSSTKLSKRNFVVPTYRGGPRDPRDPSGTQGTKGTQGVPMGTKGPKRTQGAEGIRRDPRAPSGGNGHMGPFGALWGLFRSHFEWKSISNRRFGSSRPSKLHLQGFGAEAPSYC